MQYLRRLEEVNRSPGNGIIDDCNRWMLELDPGSSAIAASAINHGDISSPLHTQFGIQGCSGVRLACLPVLSMLEL